MRIIKANLQDCHAARGVVVVIDVLRAFTTTAFAFAQGAREIVLVASPEEAFELRRQDPDLLLAGEVNGFPIEGFDLPNSPAAIAASNLESCRLAMRTTAGTQGVVRVRQASHIYVASLSVASATARHILELDASAVTFVETGRRDRGGEEDCACADYIASLLSDTPTDLHSIRERVRTSSAAAKFLDTTGFDFPRADLELALEVDRFAFAMKVENVDNYSILRPVR